MALGFLENTCYVSRLGPESKKVRQLLCAGPGVAPAGETTGATDSGAGEGVCMCGVC